jgi:hypothetical protein
MEKKKNIDNFPKSWKIHENHVIPIMEILHVGFHDFPI